jgi:hypothetical protein
LPLPPHQREHSASIGICELSERNDMTNDKTILIGWLLAGVLMVTIVFNGMALALS